VRTPQTVASLENLGRIRLSKHFFFREFLYSEIAVMHGIRNLPDDPDLAIKAGQDLCEHVLEPLQATFGRISIRSGFRSAELNAFGNKQYSSCGKNEYSRGRHIWDQRSEDGGIGAMATIIVPWLADRVGKTATWQGMAWWIHDNLPYSDLQFFPKWTAFNISWSEKPKRRITSFVAPRGLLTKAGLENQAGDHSRHYPGFPELRRD
jgi:hypothetical protein